MFASSHGYQETGSRTLVQPQVLVTMSGGPAIEWTRTYNGISGIGVVQAFDGGYVTAGFTSDPDVAFVLLLVKTDSNGKLEWSKTYRGNETTIGYSLVQASDGGYVIAGSTNSSSGNPHGWLAKTDSSGSMLWNRTYGDVYSSVFLAVVRTVDGGYAACGSLGLPWIVKTDAAGNLVWNKTFDIGSSGLAVALKQTGDGGYIVGGHRTSFPGIANDFWIARVDSLGNTLWERDLSDQTDPVWLLSLIETSDQGFFAVGGDRFVKIDSHGNVEWEKRYVSFQTKSSPFGIVESADKGIVIASEPYLLKLDSLGNILWNQTTHGVACSMARTEDFGYIVSGQMTGRVWLMKVAPEQLLIPMIAMLLVAFVSVAAVALAAVMLMVMSVKKRSVKRRSTGRTKINTLRKP